MKPINILNKLYESEGNKNGYIDIALGFQYDINSLDDLPNEADIRDSYTGIKCSIPKTNILRVKGPKSILKRIINDNKSYEDISEIKELNEADDSNVKVYSCMDCCKDFEIENNEWPYGEGNCPYCLSGDVACNDEEGM